MGVSRDHGDPLRYATGLDGAPGGPGLFLIALPVASCPLERSTVGPNVASGGPGCDEENYPNPRS